MEPKENPELKMNSKFHFGMYKGKSVINILSLNPFYIIWTLQTIVWIKYDKSVIDRIKQGFTLNKFFTLPFGKHVDKKLIWVLKNDIAYFLWFYELLCKAYDIEIDEELKEIYKIELENANVSISDFYTDDIEDQLNFYN
jgi:hypothetical protein